jgi:mono/diheme cytochrome c family protein
MAARVIASTDAEFQTYVSSTAASELGRAEFQGVCATCHGMQGQGGYGPNLSQNSLLTQKAGLAAIVRNGRGKMPPVGNSWTNAQMDALLQYAKSHIYKGASASGG